MTGRPFVPPAAAAAEPGAGDAADKDKAPPEPAAAAAAAEPTAAAAVADTEPTSSSSSSSAAAADEVAALAGSVVLLSPGSLEAVAAKAKYRALFHVLYFDCHHAHLLTPAVVAALLAPRGAVVLETAKYTVDLTVEQRAAFVAKLLALAAAAGLACATQQPDSADVLLCTRAA